MRLPRTRDDISPDEPVRLSEACRIFFGGSLGPAALRSENRKGNLVLERIAGKDFVTANAIKAMREKCQFLGNPKSIPTGREVDTRLIPADQVAMSPAEALSRKLDRLTTQMKVTPAKAAKGW